MSREWDEKDMGLEGDWYESGMILAYDANASFKSRIQI